MKYMTVCILTIFAFLAFAENIEGLVGYSNTVPTAITETGQDVIGRIDNRPTRPPLDNATLPNPDDPSSDVTHPDVMPSREPRKVESFIEWSFWGNDLLVYNGMVGSGQDFDMDPNTDDIYAAFDTDHATGDSLCVLRSTDGGATWSLFLVGTNSDGYIENPKVRVFERGGQTWVAFIGIWYEPSGAQLLYMRRVPASGGTATWEQVDDSVSTADLDADTGTDAWLHCTYTREPDDDIYAARNDISGAGWDITVLFTSPLIAPYASIAAGGGGRVAVAFIDDRITTDMQVRIKRSTDYGSTWLGSAQVSNTAFPLSYTDIAYSFGNLSGWIFVTYDVSGSGQGDNLGYYYTTDGGSTWTYGGLIGFSSDDENMGTVRSLKGSGSVTLAYNQDVGAVGDSTMFSWALATSPTNFSSPVRINDYSATGYWPPCAGWIETGSGAYSAVLYTSWTEDYKCYLDWYGNTGILETNVEALKTGILSLTPNPVRDLSRLSFALRQSGTVRITLYDITGRLVRDLAYTDMSAGEHSVHIDSRNLAAGVYLVRVEIPEGVSTETMTVVR